MSTIEEKESYRQIIKSTTIFGGAQFVQILIGIIRTKLIAILLGPSGIGISGLFTSSAALIQGFTSLGLSTSAVKSVAEANSNQNTAKINLIVSVVRKLVWLTGLLGMIVTILFSRTLSYYTFGSYDFTNLFICLSITLLIQQLIAGQNVILQGTRQLKSMAMASTLGSFIGLLITVPIYYVHGVDGIVPALIVNAISALIITSWFSRKTKIVSVPVSKFQLTIEGKKILKMGFVMTLNSILVIVISYLLRAYIRLEGGLKAVGFFTAGFTIVQSYVGLVFTAMSTDYYPRLVAVNDNQNQCTQIVNQQAEVAILILSPLMMIFIIFMPEITALLYTPEFMKINDFMKWAVFGMSFKSASWAIAYQFIAKGELKLFIFNELIANTYLLALNFLGFKLYGFPGLGISFLIFYILYCIQVFLIARKRYNFKISELLVKVFFVQISLLSACIVLMSLDHKLYIYTIGTLLIMFSILHSYLKFKSKFKNNDGPLNMF
jgi:O-antigen/teichoic acid export membrane protein